MFYFDQGENTLTLGGENEPLAIRKISLVPVQEREDYDS